METGSNAVFYGSGEPLVKREVAPVPAAPVWLSTHFDSLPIVGWHTLEREFHAAYPNQSVAGPNKPYPRPDELGQANPFLQLFARALVDGDASAEDRSKRSVFTFVHQDRSGIVPLFLFGDNDGASYSSLVIKGIGYVNGVSDIKPKRFAETPDSLVKGGEFAIQMVYDAEVQELLIRELSLRVPRTVAVFIINPADFDHEKVSTIMEKYPRMGQGIHGKLPYLAVDVRAMRNPLRLTHVLEAHHRDIAQRNITFSSRLLHRTDRVPASSQEYFDYFWKTMAASTGKIAGANLLHRNMISSNITLAAELVDFDTMTNIANTNYPPERALAEQTFEALMVLECCAQLGTIINEAFPGTKLAIETEFARRFIEQYGQQISDPIRNNQLTESLRKALSDPGYLQEVVVDQQLLNTRFPKVASGRFAL